MIRIIKFTIPLVFLVILIVAGSGRFHLRAAQESPANAASKDGKIGPGDHTRSVTVGSLQRRYLLHLPTRYDAAKPIPVIIAYHGGGGNPASMVRLSGLNAKSEEAGFMVVYPYGTGPFEERMLSFNGGECCA